MRKGDERGVFFCAKVGERTYLRFVHANEDWTITKVAPEEAIMVILRLPLIEHEIGRCLRLIEYQRTKSWF